MNFNQAQFAAIVETAKEKAANHPAWLRAIEKAATMLASGELCVTLFADSTALITSPNGSYRVNGACPCAARTAHCYHRAGKRLVEMMEAAPVAAPCPVRVPTITRSIERDVITHRRLNVVRVDGWTI